ncbi:TIGR02757 family protein [Verrucomicrobiota bacterium]
MITKQKLDRLYRKYNRRKYVSPDPLQFLYDYTDVRDREIVGLIASSLAYGRVAQILRSVETVLEPMGPSPRAFLMRSRPRQVKGILAPFKHRFTAGDGLASLLAGIKRLVTRHGSLNQAFLSGMQKSDSSILPALKSFANRLNCSDSHLVPCPSRGSACKRLNLFLRWMVRKDAVDPGGWTGVPKSRLIVPLDTHMANIGRTLGLTHRRSADMKMAIEITESFRKLAPRDPAKYDFALTRFGIRSDMEMRDLLGEEQHFPVNSG